MVRYDQLGCGRSTGRRPFAVARRDVPRRARCSSRRARARRDPPAGSFLGRHARDGTCPPGHMASEVWCSRARCSARSSGSRRRAACAATCPHISSRRCTASKDTTVRRRRPRRRQAAARHRAEGRHRPRANVKRMLPLMTSRPVQRMANWMSAVPPLRPPPTRSPGWRSRAATCSGWPTYRSHSARTFRPQSAGLRDDVGGERNLRDGSAEGSERGITAG